MAGDDRVVVDSSVFAAIFLREPGFDAMAGRLGRLRRVRSAPFFRFEVANALWKHASNIPDLEEVLEALFALPVDDAFDLTAARAGMAIALARRETFYDSAFVAICKLESLPLWTLDRRQAKMANAENVRLVADARG